MMECCEGLLGIVKPRGVGSFGQQIPSKLQ